MTDAKKNFISVIPFVIADTSKLIKVESLSNSSTTMRPARSEDSLWQYPTSDGNFNFYGKNTDVQNKPYLGLLNEYAARNVAENLDINFQPVSGLHTHEGWKIGTIVDFDFTVSMQQLDPATLNVSEEDKLINFISHILLADSNGNAGSVLIHANRRNISRVDFERCWGCVGETYNTDVLTSLGSISPGPFYNEIKNGLSLDKIKSTTVFEKIKVLNLDAFFIRLCDWVDALGRSFPEGNDELLRIKEHIFNCLKFRHSNFEKLLSDQLNLG